MWKFQKYSVVVLGLLIWACSGKCGPGGNLKPLHHTRNVKVLMAPDTKFEVPDISNRFQVVTFTASFNQWSFLNSPWEATQPDFPEVEYIFYYSGDDTTGLKKWMAQNKFAYPILFDYTGEFREKNIKGDLTNISFVVKDGKKVDLAQAANPTYKEKLEEAFYK